MSLRATRMPRPPPPAAALISTGKPISWASRTRLGLVDAAPFAAGHHRNAGLLGELAGLVLVAEHAHRLLRRADEFDVAGAANLGEVRVLRQEAVAGMDGLDVGDLRRADEPGNVQIAFRGNRRADADGLVRQRQVRRAAVGLAEDRDHFDAHVAARADDAQGDFTAIGYENALEHGLLRLATLLGSVFLQPVGSTRNSTCPYSTGC